MDELEINEIKNGLKFEDVLFIYKKLFNFCANVSNHSNLVFNSLSGDLDDQVNLNHKLYLIV